MTAESDGIVVHAADLHLGAPLKALGGRTTEAKAQKLREMSARAFDRLVDLACHREASALVLAGDVYDGADREVGAQLRFAAGMERLCAAGVRVFIAHGNHDPVVASYRTARVLPDNVTVFPSGEVTVHEVDLPKGAPLQVAGISFGTQHETSNLAQRFHALASVPHRCVAVLHANLEGLSGHDPYAPCSLADLENAPVGYWALGHIHQRSVQAFGAHRWWAYPGNLQGRSTKPAECGPKGALVVRVLPGGFAEPEFVACDTVRFVRLDVDVSAAERIGDVFDLVETALAQLVESAGDLPHVVRVRLTGQTSAHADISDASDQLTELARSEIGSLMGDGELLKVIDATGPKVDRGQALARGDLLAAVLEHIDALSADPSSVVDVAVAKLDQKTANLLTKLASRDPHLGASLLAAVEQLVMTRMAEQ